MSKVESTQEIKKSVGRPKSLASHAAILKATRDMLDEVGPARVTIDAIAKRAGVGKPTIYRSWSNAQELAMAAIIEPSGESDVPRAEDLEGLLVDIITRLNTKRGRHMALMLASSEPDGELFKAFANRVILKGRQEGLAILQAQVARGDIAPETDLAMVLDMMFGAIMLRLLLRHETLDQSLAKQVLELAMHGIQKGSSCPA
jgi:AcrR family transcriptional regulator